MLCIGTADKASAAEGQAKAAPCAACHGPDGNSINPEWPNLAGQHASYVVAQLKAFKDGGRVNANMVPMVAGLSEQDMIDIAEYYSKQGPTIGTITVEQVAAGEALYRGGNKESGIPACMACHGPNGAGNPAAAYPALRGQHPTYTSIQLKAYRDGARTTDQQSIMRTIAARMSDEQIDSVARYLHALH
jgi:cytochrome c553